jgi:hypothetical protein
LQEEQGQLQLCDDVYARRSHFVGVHEDMRHSVKCQVFGKKIQFFILASPIGLHSNYFLIKFAFNKVHEIVKDIKDIRLLFDEMDPSEFAKIINEAHIIFVATYGYRCRTPNIGENLL